MSEREGITAEEVREIAAGAIAGWAPGWTGDDGVNPQRRVRVTGYGDRYADLRVEGAPWSDETDREFRVMLIVAELQHPAGDGITDDTEAVRAFPGEIKPGPPGHSFRGPVKFSPPAYPYIAPVETGEPFRSAAEREWDDSRGGD